MKDHLQVPRGGPDPLDELLQAAKWPDQTSDPLNKLLALAEWPEPATGALLGWWQQMTAASSSPPSVADRQRNRRRVAWIVSVCGTIALFVIAISLRYLRTAESALSARSLERIAAEKPLKRNASNEEGAGLANRPQVDGDRIVLEIPSTRNDFAIAWAEARLRSKSPSEELSQRMQRSRQRAIMPEDDDPIERALTERIAGPDGDFEQLTEPLLADRAEYERQLLARFHAYTDERALAAIDLLGCVGGEACMPLLLRLGRMSDTHAAAVRAMLKIADAKILSRLAINETDPDLRKEITAALRERGDQRNLAFVLADQGDYPCSEVGPELLRRAQ